MKLSKRTLILLTPILLLLSALVIWAFLIIGNMNEEGYTVFLYEGDSESWSIQLEIIEHNETEKSPADKLTIEFKSRQIERPAMVLMNHEDVILPVQLMPEDPTVHVYNQHLQSMIQRDHIGFPQPIQLVLEWDEMEEELTLEFISTVVRNE